MKLNFTYLLPLLLLVIFSGCGVGNKNSNPAPNIPEGNFAGQFRLITKHPKGGTDTLKANIKMALEANSTYAVSGDTATVHAGSFGNYAVGINNYITFYDKTYPKTGTPTKTHLNGLYLYFYDGSTFQIVAFGALDTLILQYDLKKTP